VGASCEAMTANLYFCNVLVYLYLTITVCAHLVNVIIHVARDVARTLLTYLKIGFLACSRRFAGDSSTSKDVAVHK